MSMLDWPEVHHTEVDGVPVVWASVPGPLRAGLMLRVGSADETLVTSGITHLLEHLALFGIGRPGDHSNGHVDQTTLHLHCVGDAGSVTHFIGAVSRQLTDVPTARLADELGVLRSELAGRRSTIEDSLLAWRYGALTYGLTAQTQYALETVDADQIRAWAGRHATRGNAVIWLSGPPPSGLRVHLEDGEPVPAPDARRTIQPGLPAWFSAPDSTGVALHAVLPRDHASPAVAAVLQSRLVDRLRVEGAMAYSPQTDYRAMTRDAGRLLAVSDLVDGRQTEAVRVFTTVLADMADQRPPSPDELSEWRDSRGRDAAEPLAPLSFVAAQAWNLLVGHPVVSAEEADTAMRRLTSADVAASAGLVLGSAVAAVPDGVALTHEPWQQAAPTILDPLEGVEVRGLVPSRSEVLVVSPQGLTWRGGTDHVTVPSDGAAAVLHWQDGRRVVIGNDANRIVVEPTLWLGGRSVVQHVDAVFAAELRVDQGERDAEEIPQPPALASSPPPPSVAAALWSTWWPRLRLLLLVVLVVALVVAAVVARRPALLFWPLVILAFRHWAHRDPE